MTSTRESTGDGEALPAIDGFVVRRRIGEGGMGVVYEAEQVTPRRVVALKVARRGGRGGPEDLEPEADALALLSHPGVVPLLARGRTSDGASWLALERVDGRPLDVFVREERPPLRARIDLFRQLCDAVAHAHQRGVVHRDLKPSNVLVVAGPESSGRGSLGRVRVLDFGLARLVPAEVGEGVARVEAEDVEPSPDALSFAGTLAYASPEQAQGGRGDARSDVYALGGLLYELLTGRRALDLKGCWLGEAARRIATEEPRPPHRVAKVPRDLSAIATKALAKEPRGRYASAGDLRDDVDRWLSGRVVAAAGTSPVLALRSAARRHKAATAALAAALVGLLLAGPLLALSARRQADEMRQARDRARAVLRFQEDVLSAADPHREGRDVRLSSVLRRAGATLDRADGADPAGEEAVRVLLGRAWRSVGDRAEARRHLERAVELVRARGDGEGPEAAALTALLASLASSEDGR